MRTLARAALTDEAVRDYLPRLFRGLQPVPAGSIVMIAATPASGKSFLALKWVQVMGLRTLYLSADTDPTDQIVRAAAIVTGERQSDIRTGLMEGGADYYSERLAEGFGHVRWVFESDPTFDDIAFEAMAYAEAFGEYPQVLVVDNLTNVVGEQESEWASQKEAVKVLKRLNRLTGMTVIVIHHMNEVSKDPSYPSPRKDIANKLSQFPTHIYSLAASEDGEVMRIAEVKFRGGRQSPTAGQYVTVYTDLDRGLFFNSKHDKEVGLAV